MPYTREQMREYMRLYRGERMRLARERLGNCCAICGETKGLQFDHVDRTTKTKPLTKLLHASKADWEAELCKCQLLCTSCHRAKTAGEFGYVDRPLGFHGTASMYQFHGCRCSVCKTGNAVRKKASRQRRAERTAATIPDSAKW